MRKFLLIILSLSIGMFMFQSLVLAQNTILPKADEKDCDGWINTFNEFGLTPANKENLNTILGCAVTTGRVSLTMVPYFIQYFSNYLLGIVSLVALLFVVIGGFLYIMGGLTQQKEKGKTFITNALIGMVIAFLAWSIVNVLISALTG